jgi:hypothetical protein
VKTVCSDCGESNLPAETLALGSGWPDSFTTLPRIVPSFGCCAES